MPATAFDPSDTIGIGDRLISALGPRLGGISLLAAPVRLTGGIDTYVYRFRVKGDDLPPEWQRSLVLRVYPSLEQGAKAEREFAVQSFVSGAGFPAPRPVLVDPDGGMLGLPLMIMERLPGTPMLDRLKNPFLIPRMLTVLADTHARLHALPVDGWPLPHDGPLVERLMPRIVDLIEQSDLHSPRAALAWLQSQIHTVREETLSVCHTDFHPLNVLLDRHGKVGVVDWSDSDVGDRHADVARTTALFWLAPPLARTAIERRLLSLLRGYAVSGYLRRYEQHFPVDRARLIYWQVFHATHAWAQVLALRKGRTESGARPEAAAEIPETLTFALKSYIQERIK